jgi:membrane-bound metal-dependent hydrolase YbcI (DUF457 family)
MAFLRLCEGDPMKRATHLLLGAAVSIPVALTLSPGLALGAAWWGMVGGGFPDWFDLRSEFRRSLRLRHRGASHGLPFAIAMVVGLYLLLQVLHATPFTLGDISIALPARAVRPWTLAFAFGILSHLISDAWTHAGIRPFLPFSSVRVWVVPRLFRGRASGPLDALVRFIAMLAILVGLLAYLWVHAI